ncbi:Crt homolog 2 (Chloroquine resistance transporter paralog 2) (DdCRTp2) [Durusdinium trenchii]|uniref:Crt homolog 2 (Chloroquine resistance transporter paralog 2) (DdCRTp2) n=2 Tax=Durusdinium trenchii TaxID=1381693 RepID=A0ABP0LZB4_9DINO
MQSVFGACAVNCAVSIVSTCLYYSELHHLREFPFFAAQLNAAIGAFLAGLWFAALPKGTQQVPQWQQWASLSGLLALQNTLEILSIPRVGNEDLPPILQQAVVPLSLLFSWQLLRRKYSKVQLLGATMVVAGVTAGFLPSLWNTGGKTVSPSWVAIFLLSRVPQAAANVASATAYFLLAALQLPLQDLASFDEGLVVVCEQNEAHLVPVPEEKRRSFGDIRDQLKTEPSRTSHPLSQPKSMQPAKPLQVNFSQQRLSQVCLRDVEEHDDRGHGSATGTTIYDDFRGLPRKLQEQVASLYQELEETKECKRRAEQENVEIMNYLSAILNDDTPAQYALTMGPLDSLPPGPQEEEEEGDEEGGKRPAEETASPLRAPEPFEPPPPLPFPAERVSAAPHLVSQPPPAPDFLSKPLVNISFGGGPPESWGSSTETRRPADVLQESLATVLPTAFRQLLDRPQALAEQQMQHFQERQQLQQSLQQVQQQLQQLQQQVSQGKKPETPLHSQRSLLEQLRAELAAERRRMQEQQRLQMEQEQQKQVQQQHLLEQLSRQMLQAPQDQPHLSSEVQRMLSELRTSGEATIAELRIALDELRQSKQRLDRQASMPAMPFPEQASMPMPFAMEQETTSLPRAFRKQSPLWEEPIHAPPSLLRSPPAAPPDIFGVTIAGSKSEPACPHCGQVYLPNAFFCRSCQMKRHLPEVLHRLPPGRRRGQPVQPLQVPRSVIFDKELARWDSRAEQLEARFRRLRDARR